MFPDYETHREIINWSYEANPSDVTYTVNQSGWILAHASTENNSVTAFMRVFVNGYFIYDGFTPTGTYRYLNVFFPVKNGDIIKISRNYCKAWLFMHDLRV